MALTLSVADTITVSDSKFVSIGGDTHGSTTLVMSFDAGASTRGEAPGGWFWDIYNPNIVCHYGEEGEGVHGLLMGSNTGVLYQYAGTDDDGQAYPMEFTTPSLDQGDPRSNKLYGDIMVDSDTKGLTAYAVPYFNNNGSNGSMVAITNASGRALTTIPTGASSWQVARNISMFVAVNVQGYRPEFYIWEPRWTFEFAPIAAISWEISPTTFGTSNFKHMGLVRIGHVSTVNLSLTVTIDGTAQTAVTITHSSGAYKETIFRVPVYKGKLFKIRLASSDGSTNFRLDPRATSFDIKNWGSDDPYHKVRCFGDYSFVEG